MKPNESFIEQPVRSLQTMLRIIAKDDQRLPSIIPDGIYGPSTTQAVAAFQRIYGIPVTGVTDQTTWEAIVAAYEPALIRVDKAAPIEILLEPGEVLKLGDSSPYIYLLQSLLIQLSQDNIAIPPPVHNGVFDEETSAAIRAFQILAELPQTGELDRVTWYHLVQHFTLNAQHNIQRNKTNLLNFPQI